MWGFPVGVVLLFLAFFLIYMGVAHRVLDRMRLSDRAALLILAGMVVGSFINIRVASFPVAVSLNVGGFLIPVGLAVYVLAYAGSKTEQARAIMAVLAVAATVYFFNSVIGSGDPWHRRGAFMDPLFVYPVVAGVVAYLVGRSRRTAFISAALGVLVLDVVDYFRLLAQGVPGAISLGGAGVFDATVIAGIIAVILAEVFGEARELVQGGPVDTGRAEELVQALKGWGGRLRSRLGRGGGGA